MRSCSSAALLTVITHLGTAAAAAAKKLWLQSPDFSNFWWFVRGVAVCFITDKEQIKKKGGGGRRGNGFEKCDMPLMKLKSESI